MFKKSFNIFSSGLLAMMIGSAMFYFESRSFIAYGFFILGFFLVGIGILIGFAKMVSEK